MTNRAVLILAFGGPRSLEEVEPFIKRVLKGREVPEAVIEGAKKRYAAIGGSSPLLAITEEQAELLEEGLKKRGEDVKVYMAMLNWYPSIEETLEKIAEDGAERLYVLVMSSHTSPAATGGYKKAVEEALKNKGRAMSVTFVECWHTHPLYIEALREKIKEALEEIGADEKTLVLFTAHSLPEELLVGDPYVRKLQETIEALSSRMKLPSTRLAFQSKGGRGRWLGPQAEEVIEEAAKEGIRKICVVPLGFVADHVETLYDIDIAMKGLAESLGVRFVRAGSLNTSDRFIQALVDVIWKKIRIS